MKRSVYASLVLGAALLAGCSSHGGGGGGGGSASIDEQPVAERPALSVAALTQGLEEMGPVDDNYNGNAGLKASITNGNKLAGLPDEDGKSIEIREGNSIDVMYPGGSVVIEFSLGPDGVVKEYGKDEVTARIVGSKPVDEHTLEFIKGLPDRTYDAPGEHTNLEVDYYDGAPELFTGTVTYGDTFIALNAYGDVPLEYSGFGAWGWDETWSGKWVHKGETVSESDAYRETTAIPVAGGVSEARRAPETGVSFTGKAMALASDWGGPDGRGTTPTQAWLFGDAELKVNSATSADLTLAFDNFYDLGFKLKVNGSEFFSHENPTLTAHGRPIFEFGDPNHPEVKGGFYGNPENPAAAASEATGIFVVEGGNDDTHIAGSFGVKKN